MKKKTFEPKYHKCKDKRKEVYHGICKYIKKDTIMVCNLNKKPCVAWNEYKHEE